MIRSLVSLDSLEARTNGKWHSRCVQREVIVTGISGVMEVVILSLTMQLTQKMNASDVTLAWASFDWDTKMLSRYMKPEQTVITTLKRPQT